MRYLTYIGFEEVLGPERNLNFQLQGCPVEKSAPKTQLHMYCLFIAFVRMPSCAMS